MIVYRGLSSLPVAEGVQSGQVRILHGASSILVRLRGRVYAKLEIMPEGMRIPIAICIG